jgi:hypothetical protein
VLKEMSISTARRLFVGSMVALGLQAGIVCPCGFAPGWANGWPGISKHVAFAGVMTFHLLLAQLILATGLLAPLSAGLERMVRRAYVGWGSFLALMAVALVVAIDNCSRVYPALRDAIAEEWH